VTGGQDRLGLLHDRTFNASARDRALDVAVLIDHQHRPDRQRRRAFHVDQQRLDKSPAIPQPADRDILRRVDDAGVDHLAADRC
jgi:hypothetical protein